MLKNLHIFLIYSLLILQINTYWAGAGDTPTMNEWAIDGHYARFTEFPVHVKLAGSSRWQPALEHAITQLTPIISLESTRADWDVLIQIMSPLQFKLLTPCEWQQVDGCTILILGEDGLQGRVWIKQPATLPPEHILLHELIHALGLMVHSPYPDDVMYNGQDATPIVLSERDIATLQYLYQQPAWTTDQRSPDG